MAIINQTFPSAPMGRRIMLTGVLVFGLLVIVFVGNLYAVMTRMRDLGSPGSRILQSSAPVFPLVFAMLSFGFERFRTSQIKIENNVLVLGRKRYPLEGLSEAVQDSDVLRNARRQMANGGMGAIRGKFRSARLGSFEAFLTDPERAVVLKWPDKVVAVSPADPEFFIYSARSAAGL
jgi:hypothetical protein